MNAFIRNAWGLETILKPTERELFPLSRAFPSEEKKWQRKEKKNESKRIRNKIENERNRSAVKCKRNPR